MPTLPPADGVVRAVLFMRIDSQEVRNVLHYVVPEGGVEPNPAVLAERLWNEWNANIRPAVSNALSLYQVVCTDLSAGSAPGSVFAGASPLVGAEVSAALPNNVSCVFSLKTALRGRSYQGRIYHIGLTEQQVTANAVGATFLTTLLTGYRALRLLEGASGEPTFQLAVLSYWLNKALRATPVSTPVTLITSDGVIDSQRRRLPGRGR